MKKHFILFFLFFVLLEKQNLKAVEFFTTGRAILGANFGIDKNSREDYNNNFFIDTLRIGTGVVFDEKFTGFINIQFHAADRAITIEEAQLTYTGKNLKLSVGQIYPIYNLEIDKSMNDMTNIDYSTASNAFVLPFSGIGVLTTSIQEHFVFNLSLMGNGFEDYYNNIDVNAWVALFKGSYSKSTDNSNLHIGLNAGYGLNYGEDTAATALDGRFSEGQGYQAGLEFIYQNKGSTIMSELIYGGLSKFNNLTLETGDTRENLNKVGFYIEYNQFLTADSKIYLKDYGVQALDKVLKPVGQGGAGAWEVFARYSLANEFNYLNSNKSLLQNDFSFGFSWTPIVKARVLVAYTFIDKKHQSFSDTYEYGNKLSLSTRFFW